MVRRRKTSDETTNPIPARQTRRRRNAEDESSAEVETPEISQVLPSTGRRGRYGRKREYSSPSKDLSISTRSQSLFTRKSSSDSDTENKLEPSHMDTSYLTRLRAKRVADSSQSAVANADAVAMMEAKRYTKLKRVLAATSNNTTLENTSAFKTPAKVTRSQTKIVSAKVNPMSDDYEMSSATNVRITEKIESGDKKPARDSKNIRSSALKRIIGTPTTVLRQPRRDFSSKISPVTVTPESSPMLINLTPHRSTKTPKKSPKNIGSPKSHSQSPLRLSKTPRKLTVNDESPTISDKSNTSPPREISGNHCDPFVLLKDYQKEGIDDSNDIHKLSLQEISCTPQPLMAGRKKGKKSPKTSPPKSSKKVLKKSPVQSLRRFSTTEDSTEQKPLSPGSQKSPRNSAGKRRTISGSKIRKSPTKTPISTSKKSLGSKLETRIFTPVQTILNGGGTGKLGTPMSPKRTRSLVEKRSPITSSGTPLRPIPTPKIGTVAESGGVPIPMCTVSVNNMKMLLEIDPISPSAITPRHKVRRSLNLTPDFRTLSSNSTSSPLPTSKTGSTKKGQSLLLTLGKLGIEQRPINDESLELVDGNEFMNSSTDMVENSGSVKDRTYELIDNTKTEVNKNVEKDVDQKVDHDTYELLEPKTPILQRTTRKRSLANVEPDSCTPEAKKRCRVRFLSPTPEVREKGSPGVSSRKLPTVNTPAKQQQTATRSLRGSIGKTTPRRSRSLTKIDEKLPVLRSGVKKRSMSASESSKKRSNLSQKKQISVNRLSQPRQSVYSEVKAETKTPLVRKAPNFAQIHQRRFAQMESLVDAKKRVAKRHIDLSTLPSTIPSQSAVPELLASSSSKTLTPSQATNGTFNRFGFKLRKADALKVITKNLPAVTRKKNNETNRNLLQGVRTNRRFELLMKARNIQ